MAGLQLLTQIGMALLDGFGLRGIFLTFVSAAIFLALFGMGMAIFRNRG